MDSNELHNIEFLDLNGIDKRERLQIRNLLHEYNSNVQLPWIKEKKETLVEKGRHNKDEPEQCSSQQTLEPASTHHNNYIQPLITAPPVYYNHQQPSMMVQPILTYHPSNIVYYAANPMSPVSPPYPQQVFIPHSTYSPSSTNYGFQVPLAEKADDEDFLPKQNGTSENDQGISNGTLPDQELESIEESSIIVNGNENTTSLAPVNKSWASLFNAKKSSNIMDEKATIEQAGNYKTVDVSNQICPLKHPRKTQQFVDPDCYRMGEYLSSYVIDGRALNLKPRGLSNQSNYCYVNAILQALVACPPLYNLLSGLAQNISLNERRKPTPVVDAMCRFMKEFKNLPPGIKSAKDKNAKKDLGVIINTDTPFAPVWIYKLLNGVHSHLVEGRQEDAEEFLGFLLNGLNDEMLELIKLVKKDEGVKVNEDDAIDKEWKVMRPKNKGSITRKIDFERTPISEIFGGLLKSKIQRAGDLSTENIQPFLTLQLNIQKVKTVREALDALVNKHQLEGLTSSKTNEEVEAWQQVFLDELPIILTLHLKCFDYKQNGCSKIVKALEFPIDLKIDQKLLATKTQTPKEKHYKLFAVVYHEGKEASKGHYLTDAFHVGYSSWLRYDDSSVKTVQEEQVLKPQGTRIPYLLFYRRCDTIRGK